MKCVLQSKGDYLYEVVKEDRDKVQKHKENKLIKAELKGEINYRSRRQLALYWTLCGKVSDNTNFPTREDVSEWVKLKVHWVEIFYDMNGEAHVKTKSIGLDNMEQFIFNGYMKKAVKVMADELNVTEQELLESEKDL